MAIVKVNLGERSYEIVIKSGILSQIGEEVRSITTSQTVLVVTEPTVAPLYLKPVIDSLTAAGFNAFDAVIPGGECNKTLDTVAALYERMLDIRMDRTSTLLTLGGGVTGDIGGFAAATYLRGINFVQIPTTLLAQVDASIGGKVGVDLPRGKNLVGAFHQPQRVLIDPDVLATLPRPDFASGLAEMIKHGIISDQVLFDDLRSNADALLRRDRATLEDAIAKSCKVKAEIVAQDETEAGRRALLNYGHTVGHGIESATGFAKYSHGQAVAIGMVTAALIAEMKGLADEGITETIAGLLSMVELPVTPDDDLDIDAVIHAMSYDKKIASGRLRFVLPKRIGELIITDTVTNTDVISAIQEQVQRFS